MLKMSNIKVWMVVGLLLGLNAMTFAQVDLLNRAQSLYQAKNFEAAKSAVDSAITHEDVKTDGVAWHIKAFIYFELSKKYDRYKLNSAYRDSSIKSATISSSFKPETSVLEKNKGLIKKQAEAYYNMCIKLLYDSLNYSNCSQAYRNYKELYRTVDSAFDFRAKDIEFYSAVGSLYSDLFNKDNSKLEYGEVGKVALMKVLELDPKSISANINLGIIYYNQGVNLINSMAIDTPLDKLEVIQDNSTKLFKQSLPFMNNVYQLDPRNLKALESLRQIYQALNDTEKSLEFNKKLEEAKKGN
jgi:hypothetical protein